jgi:hypothetical protein
MNASPSLRTQLDGLHGEYVESINLAIAAGCDDDVAELAASYDRDATEMVARYENKMHLLPLNRPATPRPSLMRRLLAR